MLLQKTREIFSVHAADSSGFALWVCCLGFVYKVLSLPTITRRVLFIFILLDLLFYLSSLIFNLSGIHHCIWRMWR